jgi:hypothetical protein
VTSLKQIIAVLMIVLMASSCTRAVEIPLKNLDSEAESHESHRIVMRDGAQYVVDRFSTDDSTITITKWNLADTRYKHVEPPVILNREDVKALERLELDQGKSFLVFAPLGVTLLLIIGFLNSDFYAD